MSGNYKMPAEWEKHSCTWLQWPHDGTNKGPGYREKLDPIWVKMVKALHTGEDVKIVVHDIKEKDHVEKLLSSSGIDMTKVDLIVQPIDDIWMRDDGPIFVKNEKEELVISNWRFNGWGGRYPYENDSKIPGAVSEYTSIPQITSDICLEGGAIEVDGEGGFLAAKTSILNENRNPGISLKDIERELTKVLGVDNFIWITGVYGENNNDEVTDFHIDGAARFANKDTILYEYDFSQGKENDPIKKAMEKHYQEMRGSRNSRGEPYKMIPVPVTKEEVKGAGSNGSYLNYYVGNEVVLVPIYNDENDEQGLKIIEGIFPDKKIVGIDVRPLYPYGGMIHCVTQQQPF